MDAWNGSGFGGEVGFGERPALIVVDMSRGFTDPTSPLACHIDHAIESISSLLEEARAGRLPIAFTTVSYRPGEEKVAASLIAKMPALGMLRSGDAWVEIDPRLKPAPGEPVFAKLFASAFFGTSLISYLTSTSVDTLVVTGASTSGCVRATVVDAVQHGFRVIVPRQAVGDRNSVAHDANLKDIQSKYGDVVDVDAVLNMMRSRRTSGASRSATARATPIPKE